MRPTILPLLLLGLLSPGRAALSGQPQDTPREEPPALTVSVAAPKVNGKRVVDLSTADPHIDVVIRNTSRRPLELFGEDNSAGYDNLHLELLARDGRTLPEPIIVNRSISVWYHNVMQTVTLEPGEIMVREVHFTKDEPMQGPPYRNFPPMKPGDQHKIRLRAVFEVRTQRFQMRFHRRNAISVMPLAAGVTRTAQAEVWTGRVISATEDYQFNQYSP